MTSKTKSGGMRHEITRIERKVKSKYIVRVVAGVLTIALVGTGIGATAVLQRRTVPQSQPRQTAQQTAARMLMT